MGRLASQTTMSIFEEDQSLEDIPEFSQAEPEELEQLKHKLGEFLDYDTDKLKIGAAIKAIEEWQQGLESYQSGNDLT